MGTVRGFRRFISVLVHTGAIHVFWSFLVALGIAAAILTLIEPNIETYGDGLWYCFVAATTVGFGDFYAVTTIGRAVTIVITLFGLVTTATVPGVVLAYYLDYIKLREKEGFSGMVDKLEKLPELSHEELVRLSQRVREIRKKF